MKELKENYLPIMFGRHVTEELKVGATVEVECVEAAARERSVTGKWMIRVITDTGDVYIVANSSSGKPKTLTTPQGVVAFLMERDLTAAIVPLDLGGRFRVRKKTDGSLFTEYVSGAEPD